MSRRRSDPPPTLRGDQNQCPSCLELFNSTAAFDKHRVGRFGPFQVRRCLSKADMLAAGMARNARGFWVTERMGAAARRRYGDTSREAIVAETRLPAAGNSIEEAP